MVTLSTNYRGQDLTPGDKVVCPFQEGEFQVEEVHLLNRTVVVRPTKGPGGRLIFKRAFLARVEGDPVTPIDRVLNPNGATKR